MVTGAAVVARFEVDTGLGTSTQKLMDTTTAFSDCNLL